MARYGSRHLPRLSQQPSGANIAVGVAPPDSNAPPTLGSVFRELRALIRRVGALERITSVSQLIKSVQPFTIAINAGSSSGTATITAVDTTKAFVSWGGTDLDATAAGGGAHNWLATLVLTNSTTVTATRGGITGTATVAGTVVEYP